MEGANIRLDGRNIVTITLCAALGYVIFIGVNMAWSKIKTVKGMPS